MKSFYLLLTCLVLSFNSFGQEDGYENYDNSEYVEEAPSLDCYQKYSKVFSERGANEVPDGTYDDVVIVVDKGGMRECYSGKVNVYNKKLVCTSVQFASDGGYTDGPKTKAIPVAIADGMSKPYTDAEGSTITVFFPKALKAKKENLKKAPEPNID